MLPPPTTSSMPVPPHHRGAPLLAGAPADPADGTALVFRTASPEPVGAFAGDAPDVGVGS